MTLRQQANADIPACNNKSKLHCEDGTTGDIMKVVLDCYRDKNSQLKKFAPALRGSSVKDTCSNVWHFVKENISYKVDPPGEQWVKEPARVWADKVCDCKSYSVFIASCLHHLGIEGYFRFVSFDEDQIPTHVYVVVPGRGEEIIIDCVIGRFNKQQPFTKKYDYAMTRISQLSGIQPSPALKTRPWVMQESPNVIREAIHLLRIHEGRGNGGFITAERNQVYEKAIRDYASGGTRIGDFNSSCAAVADQLAQSNPDTQTASQVTPQNSKCGVLPDLAALFTANGVTPAFFTKFKFLDFLDNSSNHWKSRFAFLQSYTANDRLSWYITKISTDGTIDDVIQYNELFAAGARYHGPTTKSQIDDRANVSCALAAKFNQVYVAKFLGGDDHKPMTSPFTFNGYDMTLDTSLCSNTSPGTTPTTGTGTGTKDFSVNPDKNNPGFGNPTQTNGLNTQTILIAGAAVVALVLLTRK